MSEQLSPGAQTIVDERTEERSEFRVEEGDHERFSHYVRKENLTEAMVMGTPVVALCGKVWVPSRDPERFPGVPGMQRNLGKPRRRRRVTGETFGPARLLDLDPSTLLRFSHGGSRTGASHPGAGPAREILLGLRRGRS